MSKILRTGWLLIFVSGSTFAQKPAMSPANEPPAVGTLRSLHSMGADLNVPLCPAQFHDSLRTNGIAGPNDQDVTQPKVKTKVPALLTQQAIAGLRQDAYRQLHRRRECGCGQKRLSAGSLPAKILRLRARRQCCRSG